MSDFTPSTPGFSAIAYARGPRDILLVSVSSDERRRHPRYDVRGLSGVLDGFRVFDTLKLSAGGMLILLPAELSLDQQVRVELPLGGETFESRARVVFLGPDLDGSMPSGERYRVGLEFVAPADRSLAILQRFIGAELERDRTRS